MNQALCSILCREDEWCFNSEGQTIKFRADGTGELWCRCELSVWIAATLEWESIDAPRDCHGDAKDQITEIGSSTPSQSLQLLGQLNLKITLTARLPSHDLPQKNLKFLSASTLVNQHSLTDDAFRPKLYTIRLEKGDFKEPCYVGYSNGYGSRYKFRLMFDKSPYPPRSEWKNPEEAADGAQFWNLTEFVAKKSSELKAEGRAMNESIFGQISAWVYQNLLRG